MDCEQRLQGLDLKNDFVCDDEIGLKGVFDAVALVDKRDARLALE